ncbi:MAG: COX15/CtaA family protein [Pseudomonadota bacterium]
MTSPYVTENDRQVATWLLICAGVLLGMILLGGVTRLTNSGLSMVDWRPVTGIIPPLTEQAWLDEFEQYRQYPEYQKVNKGMSLDAFKSIFMYEYLHRVLGRLIGLVYLLPLLYFAWRGQIRRGMTPKLVLLFFLGGCQGLLGWYMVKSGLVDNPRVSQYRLTAHLGLAVLIYAYMLWLAFDLLFQRAPGTGPPVSRPNARFSKVLIALVYLMILTGGLVAGTRAGYAYSTWPLMGDSFFPPGLYAWTPAWLAMFEDVTTIQFNHRMFAYGLTILLCLFAWRVYRSAVGPKANLAVALVLVALALQLVLGISTIVLHMPIALAAAHQVGAILLLSAVLFASHVLVKQDVATGYQSAPLASSERRPAAASLLSGRSKSNRISVRRSLPLRR